MNTLLLCSAFDQFLIRLRKSKKFLNYLQNKLHIKKKKTNTVNFSLRRINIIFCFVFVFKKNLNGVALKWFIFKMFKSRAIQGFSSSKSISVQIVVNLNSNTCFCCFLKVYYVLNGNLSKSKVFFFFFNLIRVKQEHVQR